MADRRHHARRSQRCNARRFAASVCGVLAACGGDRSLAPRTEPASVTPTWSEHIAQVVFEHCAGCHRPGESAPFPLLSYDDAYRKRRQIVEVTTDRFMPPWLPLDEHFAHDRRLPDETIALLARWVDAGAPEGPNPAAVTAPKFRTGWQLREPDLVIRAPEPITVPADGPNLFCNLVIPCDVDVLRYVRAVEVRPQSRAVHHAILAVDRSGRARARDAAEPGPGFSGMALGGAHAPDGHFLGWTPGKLPREMPDGMAWRLFPDTDLVLQLHLTPTGRSEVVQPTIGLYFTDEAPTRIPYALVLYSERIDIAAGERDWRLTDEFVMPVAATLHSVYPHAHYLCRTMLARATLPDGATRQLLRIDDWKFDWQDDYEFAEPLELPAGTRLSIDYRYDNSAANLANPHSPPRRVRFGPDSTDEMGTLTLTLVPKDRTDGEALHAAYVAHELHKEPGDPVRWRELARVLRARGRLDEAIGALREALQLRADYAPALADLGACQAQRGDRTAAEQSFRAALRADPEWPEAHDGLGRLLAQQGRTRDALPHLRAAAQRIAGLPEVHNNLANALFELGDLDGAETAYRAALQLRPDYFFARFNLGRVLAERGRIEEARRELDAARALRPDDAAVRQSLERLRER